MGHETHFLERLSRATAEQAETALYLYKNRKALLYILSKVTLPPDQKRVAISLDSANLGPYVVVSASGDFITCLGEHMEVGDTWQIPYLQLRHFLSQYQEYAKRFETFKQLSAEGIVEELFHLLLTRGPMLSRESFSELAAIQPVITSIALHYYVQSFIAHNDRYTSLIRIRKPDQRNLEKFQTHWNLTWSMTNFFVLFCMNGPAGIDRELKEMFDEGIFSHGVLYQGELVMAYRAIWCAGRIGGPLLPYYKEGVQNAESFTQWLEAFTGMMIIAFREPSEKQRISKILLDNIRTDPMAKHYCTLLSGDFLNLVMTVLDHPETSINTSTEAARKLLFEQIQPPGDSPYLFAQSDEIPDGLANSFMANVGGSFLKDPGLGEKVITMIPWLAKASVEDLFLPADFLEHWTPPSASDSMMDLIEGWQRVYVPPPRQAEAKIGRNAPCPCGSGKKYKRCCGR